MITNRLEPEIYSFRSLADFADAVSHAGETRYPIHLKLDNRHAPAGIEGEIGWPVESVRNCPAEGARRSFRAPELRRHAGEDSYTWSRSRYDHERGRRRVAAVPCHPPYGQRRYRRLLEAQVDIKASAGTLRASAGSTTRVCVPCRRSNPYRAGQTPPSGRRCGQRACREAAAADRDGYGADWLLTAGPPSGVRTLVDAREGQPAPIVGRVWHGYVA